MPNHIHLILFYNEKTDVSGFMRDLKKYTSVKIRQLLEKDERKMTIERLRCERNGQKYKVWKERFDAVVIRHRNVLLTKVKYIHNNPVRNSLVEYEEDWKYSSAKYYKTEVQGLLPVKHAWEII